MKYKFLWELLVILGAINFTLEYYYNEQVMITHKQQHSIITNFIKETELTRKITNNNLQNDI